LRREETVQGIEKSENRQQKNVSEDAESRDDEDASFGRSVRGTDAVIELHGRPWQSSCPDHCDCRCAGRKKKLHKRSEIYLRVAP
jgi:NAD-dependent SIR2 family protein deacetylase